MVEPNGCASAAATDDKGPLFLSRFYTVKVFKLLLLWARTAAHGGVLATIDTLSLHSDYLVLPSAGITFSCRKDC
jgi:hypothetical protein